MKRAPLDEIRERPATKLVKFTGVDVVVGATESGLLAVKATRPAYGCAISFTPMERMQAMDMQDMGPQQRVKDVLAPSLSLSQQQITSMQIPLSTHMDQKSLLENRIRVIARRYKAWPETEVQAIINMEKYDMKRTDSMASLNSSLAAACFALAVKQFQTWTVSLSEIADDFSGIGGCKCDAASVNAAETHVLSVLNWDVIDNGFLNMQPPDGHDALYSAFSKQKTPLDVAMNMVKGIVLGSPSKVDNE